MQRRQREFARGFYAIGIEYSKLEVNIGTLFRSATAFGAAYVFTVGRRYKRQASDTVAASRHMPLFHFQTVDDLIEGLPYNCPLIGVELDERAVALDKFCHPAAACYILGAEDHGLTKRTRERCHRLVQLPGLYCLNVATTGSIVMYDRITRGSTRALSQTRMNALLEQRALNDRNNHIVGTQG